MLARLAVISSLALLAAACGGGGGNPAKPIDTTTSSGFEGKVTVSPGTNTCKKGSSCTRPAVGFTLEFTQYGHLVVTTKTGKDGSYRVHLPSKGRFLISAKGGPGVAPTVKPPSATVESGQLKHLDIELDVGIR